MVVKVNVAPECLGAINCSDWLDRMRVRGTDQQVRIMESHGERLRRLLQVSRMDMKHRCVCGGYLSVPGQTPPLR